ncbi:MAG: ABC transporter ATP-binding protein [Defluviitaleaceae bacterium]|nr:ABC transporter ATP-binding protein [Defluviitaleaceae bacterium]
MVVLTDVGKRFGKSQIFAGVDLKVDASKPTVIMGKNGCGKTTLLKVAAGILQHSSGKVARLVGAKTAYVPDRFPKIPFKAGEYLTHMGEIQGLPRDFINRQIDSHFESFGIPNDIKDRKIAKCSKGTIQKINIIQAFLTKQDLVVLDEPFSGLDEESIAALIGLLTKMSEYGTAILLSCHDKELARQITDRVLLLDGEGLQNAIFN